MKKLLLLTLLSGLASSCAMGSATSAMSGYAYFSTKCDEADNLSDTGEIRVREMIKQEIEKYQ
jgi:hypothetical protein